MIRKLLHAAVFAGLLFCTGVSAQVNPVTWEPAGTPAAWEVRCMGVTSTNELFAGTQAGLFKTGNAGQTWVDVTDPLMLTSVTSLFIAGDDKIYVGTKSGLFLSTDLGMSWQLLYTPPYSWVKAIAKGSGNRIFVSAVDSLTGIAGSVYMSADEGANWTEIYGGIIGLATITCFAEDTAGNIFAVTGGGVITYDIFYEWDSMTGDWVPAFNFPPVFLINRISVDTDNRFFASNTDGMIQSSDGGSSWQPAGMYPNSCTPIAILPDHTLLTGTLYNGIFLSSDTAATWQQQSAGLPINPILLTSFDPVLSLCYDHNGRIFAGTRDSGVYRSTTLWSGMRDTPGEKMILQTYPNPFSSVTSIHFSLERQGYVELGIFDMTGKKVATPFSGQLDPGKFSISWKPAGLPDGIYFCRMQYNGALADTEKLILLK